jgi:DNA/RNA-binding protein KIN17
MSEKFKRLGKVKYYCQMCEKQCRDANGFKCHLTTEGHRARMKLFLDNPQKYIEEFSEAFEDQFMAELEATSDWLVSTEVYSGIIRQPHHVHLNATKWGSFVDFLLYLESKNLIEKKLDESRSPSFLIRRLDLERDAAIERAREEAKRKAERQRERSEQEFEKRLKIAESVSRTNFSEPTKFNPSGAKISFGLKPKVLVSKSTLQDCVVKITGGVNMDQKGTVLDGSSEEKLRIALLKSNETVLVDRKDIETVIPNLDRKVKVVNPKHECEGKVGTLVSVTEEKAKVFIPSLNRTVEFDFDSISKYSLE